MNRTNCFLKLPCPFDPFFAPARLWRSRVVGQRPMGFVEQIEKDCRFILVALRQCAPQIDGSAVRQRRNAIYFAFNRATRSIGVQPLQIEDRIRAALSRPLDYLVQSALIILRAPFAPAMQCPVLVEGQTDHTAVPCFDDLAYFGLRNPGRLQKTAFSRFGILEARSVHAAKPDWLARIRADDLIAGRSEPGKAVREIH